MHGAIGRFTAKTNKTGLALFPERQMVNHNVLTIPQNCIKRTCIDSILVSNTLSGQVVHLYNPAYEFFVFPLLIFSPKPQLKKYLQF